MKKVEYFIPYAMKRERISQSVFYIMLPFAFMILTSFASENQVSTNGNVSFTVKTLTYNGDRSPKNIVAIWIEDNNGNFVKTKLLQAQDRKEWLLSWNVKSQGSVVDATTGATLRNHQTHSIVWDCTDESGSEVEDGVYKIVVEFTEEHSQGPLTSVSFTKGPESQTITPANETYFIDMRLEYTVDATGLDRKKAINQTLAIYPNPFSDRTSISFTVDDNSPIGLRIYGLNGVLLRDTKYIPATTGQQSIQWDGKDDHGNVLPAGIYFVQIQLQSKTITGRLIKGWQQD